MTRRKIYIAGPMRGYPEHNFPAFREAEARLASNGWDVVSPVTIGETHFLNNPSVPGGEYLKADLRELVDCHAIALLDGWEASTGARCEVVVACTIGLDFYSAHDGLRIDAPARIVVKGGYECAPGPTEDALDERAQLAIAEVRRASAKFPTWPTDPFHALAVVGEEFGELHQSMLQYVYEPAKRRSLNDVRAEAVQLSAMSLRFLLSLDAYIFGPCHQHTQRISKPSRQSTRTVLAIAAQPDGGTHG